MFRSNFLFLLLCAYTGVVYSATPQFFLPKSSLVPADLAVIVNDDDPLSIQIAGYYQKRRNIPDENMIHVRFQPGTGSMSRSEFARIKVEVDDKTPKTVQAFALTWASPYRVDCMSITSAFAFGFSEKFCSHQCSPTQPSAYFNSPSTTPFTDLKIRPAMALAGLDFAHVKALIDRGVEADESHPFGTGYLVSTGDKARNVRAIAYPRMVKLFKHQIDIKLINKDFIKDKNDVLFYFTGLVNVPELDSLAFIPGAIADHLTSSGGQLTDSTQMSSLRWLEAGATGSYGTVTEPCNHLDKFPDPGVVIYWYLTGGTLIEAYWKSVKWPGEGIFIGEPLAKPYSGLSFKTTDNETIVRTQALIPGNYRLLGASSVVGPYLPEPFLIHVHLGMNSFRFRNLTKENYMFERVH